MPRLTPVSLSKCRLRLIRKSSRHTHRILKEFSQGLRVGTVTEETPWRAAPEGILDSPSVPKATSSRETPRLYEFGPFRLDPSERKLLRGNEIVALTPKAFDTLHLLVKNSGHLLEKDNLIAML